MTQPGRRVPAALENFTGFALMAAADSAERHYIEALRKVPMTLPQFIVMSIISRDDGIVARDISDKIGLTKQQISTILRYFDDVGYISRSLKMFDLRYKGIWLTDQGRDTFEQARAALRTAERKVHWATDAERQVALRSMLLGLLPAEEMGWDRVRRYLR